MMLAKVLLLICVVFALAREPLQARQQIPSDTVITLRRTNCFFTCPDYQVTISGDGTVTFEGNTNVKVKGRVQSAISRDKIQLLISAFIKANFFALRNSYSLPEDGCRVYDGDASSATISIVMNGKTK